MIIEILRKIIDKLNKHAPKTINKTLLKADDKVQGIISYSIFQINPSILKIKEKFQLNKRFSFQHVSEDTVTKVVKNVPTDKASAGEIPVKFLKESKFCFPEPKNCINESLTSKKFPETLKLPDITPVFIL